jgi:hypothetical protein
MALHSANFSDRHHDIDLAGLLEFQTEHEGYEGLAFPGDASGAPEALAGLSAWSFGFGRPRFHREVRHAVLAGRDWAINKLDAGPFRKPMARRTRKQPLTYQFNRSRCVTVTGISRLRDGRHRRLRDGFEWSAHLPSEERLATASDGAPCLSPSVPSNREWILA